MRYAQCIWHAIKISLLLLTLCTTAVWNSHPAAMAAVPSLTKWGCQSYPFRQAWPCIICRHKFVQMLFFVPCLLSPATHCGPHQSGFQMKHQVNPSITQVLLQATGHWLNLSHITAELWLIYHLTTDQNAHAQDCADSVCRHTCNKNQHWKWPQTHG